MDRRTQLTDFLHHDILGGRIRPGPDDDLLLSGLVDSINMMVVLDWIADTTGFTVPMEDVTIENFASVEAICTYLDARLDAPTRVWVLEDDDVFGPAVCRALERKGYAATRFASLGALRAAEGAPDLAVVDLRLPDGSGIDAVKHLSPVPVVVLTGHGNIPDAVETIRVGGFDFLTKPVSTTRLVEVLMEASARGPASRQDQQRVFDALERIRG
jgi:ActR/RegA family two-component response regulator